jgi:hypothetical protein
MGRVFLSYSREDKDRVRLLAAALEREGHGVWWDEHIPGGDEFGDVIEKELAAADAVVAIWTAASIRSAWVRDEAGFARDKGRLVPVTLDGTQPPLGFRQFHTIDLSGWNGRPASKDLAPLKKAIAERIGIGQRPDSEGRQRATAKARPRFGRGVLAAGIGAVVVVLGGSAAFLLGVIPGAASAAVTPTVELGHFTISPGGVPSGLSDILENEMLAAFGNEHEVSVVTGGQSGQFVLDGNIQRTADSLRFTVNLTNRRTGGLVWSHAFERAVQDSLAPRQVAVAATQVVRCGIWGASAHRETMTDKALSLYIDWCNEYWGGSPDEDRILDSARRVSAAVPEFSYAWSALALSSVPISHRAADSEARTAAREGWQAAEKAIRLNRLNPEGYMAQAGLLPAARFTEREQLLAKAIEARPTECGCERQSYGDFLTSVGRNEDAVDEYARARAMMPLAPMSNVRLAQALYVVGRSSEADEVVAGMLEAWPDAEIVRALQVRSAFWTGRYEDARRLLQGTALHLPDTERAALLDAFAALRSKSPSEMRSAAAKLEALAADTRTNDRLVVSALAALGADAAALAAANALIQARGPGLADVLFEPNMAKLAATPQFVAIAQRVGLANYWRSTRRLPDLCARSSGVPFCTVAREA